MYKEKLKTLLIDTSIFDHPLQLLVNKASLTYVRLDTSVKGFYHIDQLKIFDNTIFILDRIDNALLLFDLSGKFLKRVSVKNTQFQCLDIFAGSVYVLDKSQSIILKFNLKAELVKTIEQGFHGVQFAVLPNNKFVYNTSGLATKDASSENYQLALVSGTSGNMQLPFKTIRSGMRYFFENQFSRDSARLFFTSAFDNIIYSIDTSKIIAETKFDFGKYNMPDCIFKKAQEFDNFNAFPYVSDLVNVANTPDFSFFKFSYHHQQGYLITDAHRSKVFTGGIGIAANESIDFNDAFPIATYGDKLIAVIWPRTWLNLSKHIDLSNTQLNKKYPLSMFQTERGPFLLIYTLNKND